MIVGTAGHIDHGKTSLVRALTGIDTDRLAEEKARGISIDLGFAYKNIPGGDILGFVDVPGHLKFIGNMLAGAVGIDFVLLVIAADDGPMPQTREHLAIVELLGIRRGVIALTKCDRVDAGRKAAVTSEVEKLAAGTPLSGTEIIPVSSVTREGLDVLESRLLAESRIASRHTSDGGFRLAVDRCFTVPGAGTVATGTVFAGQVAIGDDVVVTPTGFSAKVRRLYANNCEAPRATAGERCAVNLSGSDVSVARIRRGDWIVAPHLHAPTLRLDAQICLLPTSRPLSHSSLLHLHIGTAHLEARVVLLEDSSLKPRQVGFAQIVTQKPIAALAGDRFVLRQAEARQTVAGGVVLDPWPPSRGRTRPERRQVLSALAGPTVERALERLIGNGTGWIEYERYCRAANLSSEDARAALSRIATRVNAVQAGAYLVSRAAWDRIRSEIVAALDRQHADTPVTQGLEIARLRTALPERYPPDLVSAAADALCGEGSIARSGPLWHRQGHLARLSEADKALWDRMRPALQTAAFSPPRVRDLAEALNSKEEAVRSLLRRLAKIGDVVEIATDHFYLRSAVATLVARAHQAAAECGNVLATKEFRDRIGTGRKIAIQILEFFDKSGVTVRRGETRTVRKEKLAAFGHATI